MKSAVLIFSTFSLFTCCSLLTSALAQTGLVQAAPPALRPGEEVTLSFSNAPIAEIARTIAVITGMNVVVDPRVSGTMSLNTDRPVSRTAAYNLFLSALRLQKFAAVERGGLLKIVPEADARLEFGSVGTGQPTGPANTIATQIFRLNYESANNLVPVLRPLISANNIINVNPGNNSLVITDYTDNLQRIARIIAALDVPNASDLEIIPLKHGIASDIVPMVVRLMESGPAGAATQGQADTTFRSVVLAESRSNSVIVRAANPARTALARALVERLDQPGAGSGSAAGNIYVVYLKNAEAVKLAVTLRAAMAGGGGIGASSMAGLSGSSPSFGAAGTSGASAGASTLGALAPTAAPSTGGQIQADAATNSLIITAPEPQYRQLRAVIDMLDARRAQVFVESLIAEVNADKAAEFGIQWQGALGQRGDGTVGLLGTNFGSGGNNIITLATQAAQGATVPGPGLNFGLLNRTAGVYVLGFLARFLEQTGDGNILSTPNLITLDNEEAKIVIGQNVPFVTGQFTNTGAGGGGAVNPFQTIERRDVGLTLKVRPQISENGTVRLQIFQEVSSVQPASVNSSTGLITNKRSIESNVLVEDGAIIVLGGLLQDEYAGNQDKIPVAGDLPLFGNLFKSETRRRNKTNLMVFLRPVVVRNAQAVNTLSLDRYELMRSLQKDAQPMPSRVLPINQAPVMPSIFSNEQPPNPLPPLFPTSPPAMPTPVAPQ